MDRVGEESFQEISKIYSFARIEAPSAKLQAPEKLQTPSTKHQIGLDRQRVWSLKTGASLELGAWRFEVRFTLSLRIIDNARTLANDSLMSEIIYPRSPRETMCGWMHLPRLIDKIRLHLAGKLHPDYQANFCKGFDGLWLETAGVQAEQLIEVVRKSITDGEVCDWVSKNVKKPEEVKQAHRERMLNYPKKDDAEMQVRLKMRKENAGMAHRDEIQSFVDFIDADEKRL